MNNSFYFMNKIKIKFKCVNTIKEKLGNVYALLLLNDDRIAAAFFENCIKIYNPYNNYNCELTINNLGSVLSLCQPLPNSLAYISYFPPLHFVSLAQDTFTELFTFNPSPLKLQGKVITISNELIAVFTNQCSIAIYKTKPPYEHKPFKELKGHTEELMTMLSIKEKNMLVTACNKTLRFWNLSTFKCQTVINKIYCKGPNSIYQVDDSRIVIGENYSITVINVDSCIKEYKICDEDIGFPYSFLRINEKYILLGGDGNYIVNIDEKKYIKMESEHEGNINDLIKLDDITFISCGSDQTIKVWNIL